MKPILLPALWARRLQFVVWSLPLCLATLSHVWGSSSRAMAKIPAGPTLSFEQYLIDYGQVVPTEEVRTHFGFMNMADRPIQIDRLEPSCGCLQPRLDEKYRELDPGERGEFLIRIQTANQAVGPKEYTVIVHYRDPEPRQTTVRFRVTLPDNQVALKPRALMMYLSGSSPMVQTAEVIDRRPNKFEIVKLEVEPAHLATVEPSGEFDDSEDHRHYKLRIEVNPELADGSHRGVIWVHTNDPAYQTLRLPLAVQKGVVPKTARNRTDFRARAASHGDHSHP
ncbi:MAG: DUF1573 domain-containing protein [Planctomycetaceae bacterium]|jgi:hypothetical protein